MLYIFQIFIFGEQSMLFCQFVSLQRILAGFKYKGVYATFQLQAFDGSGRDLGIIFIIIPAGAEIPKAFAWEWRGGRISTGG
jgi:hypothetical protein